MDPDWLRADLAAIYPQFGLRLAHRGLVLVPPTDVELLELADVVGEPGGIVAPGEEDFLDWPTGSPAAVDAFLRRHWALRTVPGPGSWQVSFAVLLDGRALGAARVGAERWAAERAVDTGSWLARPEQGAGVGRRVRSMLLDLAFAHLGARSAETSAAPDNTASRRVSTRLGYRDTGTVTGPTGRPRVHARLTPAAWRRRRLDDVRVDGVEALAAAIG